MAQVSVTINGRRYEIACDDGQEAHLTRLSKYIDKRVGELVAAVGQVGDARLLVMASLLIADELSDIYEQLESYKKNGPPPPQEGAKDGALVIAMERKIGTTINQLAERIEQIADRVEEL